MKAFETDEMKQRQHERQTMDNTQNGTDHNEYVFSSTWRTVVERWHIQPHFPISCVFVDETVHDIEDLYVCQRLLIRLLVMRMDGYSTEKLIIGMLNLLRKL